MTTLILAALLGFLTTACGAKPPAELDLTPFEHRVCDLPTSEQLSGFHVFWPGSPGDVPSRPSCLWESGDTRILVFVTLNPYVSTSPAQEDTGMINGLPAYRWGIPGKGTQLACATTIDTRLRQTFTATVYTPTNACAASDTIATLVIDTIQATR